MKTNRPSKKQREPLNKKGYTKQFAFKNKDLEKLKQKLLKIGGWAVVLPGGEQPDIEEYFSRGKTSIGNSTLRLGQPCQCHYNSSMLWLKSKGKIKICTGYALSEDGIWRVHTWGLQKNKIIETTEKRVMYYGYTLSRIESAFFSEINSVPASESEIAR